MIRFEKADRQMYLGYKHTLKNLYLNAFTKGVSAQKITDSDAEYYLDAMFDVGYGIFAFNQQQLIATLIATPLDFDKDCPTPILEQFNNKHTLYITEVLVDENFRGKGLGKQLLQFFESNLNADINQVLLRVWEKNEAAVKLYEKAGFTNCGTITQEKVRPQTNEKFTMYKNYMLKLI